MQVRYLAVNLAFLFLFAGCSSNDIVVKKQMEMDTRLEQLAQANVAAGTQITTLTNEVKELEARVKAARDDIDALKPVVAESRTSMESTIEKLNRLTDSHPAKIEVVNREAAPADGGSADQDAYVKAFGLFSGNNYNAAIDAFEAFIKEYPQSEYVGNVLYWVGECYYTQRNYNEALDAFNKVIETFPEGNKAPDAMLKIGYSLISLNEPVKARESLQSLVDKYPKSQAAAKARERLSRLSK